MDHIYLDHNATTPLHPQVLNAMMPYLTNQFGNGSSIHFYGRQVRSAIDKAREQVANLIGAQNPSEIVFTSGGTESDNHAIKGVALRQKNLLGNHIITTAVEHSAVLHTCEYLEKHGFEVTYLPVDRHGLISLNQFQETIQENTILTSIMYVNNEIGTIQSMTNICSIAQDRNITVHTDAVQAIGKIPVDVEDLGVNLLSLSAHKFYGPKGIGANYVRRRTRLDNFVHGGAQEQNRRAGTENIAAIVGMGEAAEIATRDLQKNSDGITKLTNRLRNGLKGKIEDICENGHSKYIDPGTLSISFKSVSGEMLLMRLDMEGICASSGSACASGSVEPSHVLAKLGLPPEVAQSTVRFSVGITNTEEQIDETIQKVTEIVAELRSTRNSSWV